MCGLLALLFFPEPETNFVWYGLAFISIIVICLILELKSYNTKYVKINKKVKNEN